MSDISKLYDEVMASAETEKVASDMSYQGEVVEFDAEFFEKVASGDEAATSELAAFIDDARAQGYDDDAIEAAIAEAMDDAGVEKQAWDEGSDIDMMKAAAYEDGFGQAIEDSLEKAASFGVTEQDILDYERGMAYGSGYAEGRQYMDEAVEKIAGAKIDAAKEMAGKAFGKVKDTAMAGGQKLKEGGKRYAVLMRGGAAGKRSMKDTYHGLKDKELRGEILKSMGARGATGAAVVGGGAGAYKVYKDRK